MLGLNFLTQSSSSASPFEPDSPLQLALQVPLKYAVLLAHGFLTSLRSAPLPANPYHPVRIVCLSDTHTLTTNDVPDGDILVHAGDLANAGSLSELQAQIDWLASLPHAQKVVIAGNHDTWMDPRSRRTLAEQDRCGDLDWRHIRYLQHNAVTLSIPFKSSNDALPPRRITIYGAPQIPACGGPDFAFQYPRGRDAWTDTIPRDIDVLVTHTPPKYHLDLPLPSGMGCEHLLRETWRVQPRVHIFGHVHVGAGKQVAWWDDGQLAYERALARPVDGLTRGLLSIGTWVDLGLVLFWGVTGVLWDRVWGGEGRATIMVNAGLMAGNTGRLGNKVQVVDI
ncbi:Metallo-dependent phosphatase [Saccharata proteae CBS 121410]|uniref:Metallo-dependent phosphatase n=1 Tax=Saccharata proteae CBS 121410 TaxID=1314787 RepID=A0A9P4LSZ0_9PEZI|nr:Metallo-dependent phosphatase [Saccharata proteae CBS 121410]